MHKRRSKSGPVKNPRECRLHCEPLEDRRMLANVMVGNLNDVVNGTTTSIAALIATPGADGISLREAILAANADTTFNDPADTIDFSVTGTIQLTNVGHAGEIVISSNLTINGPGADVLLIRAFDPSLAIGNGARIFNIQVPIATRTVALSGLTLTGGDVASAYGGGAILNRENLTITGCTIENNRATDRGGGITNMGGSLSVIASTINGNLSGNHGGGLYSKYGSLTVAHSTISSNSAGVSNSGGGIFSTSSPTTIDSSTISFNSAEGAGGIFSENAGLTITNSTISGNSARGSGGGVAAFGPLTLRHSTVTLNRCDSDNSGGGTGGGMSVSAGSVLDHTIVAGNLRTDFLYDDVAGTLTARFSLIGDNTGATITDNGGNLIGTADAPINPLLDPLANNGGPTSTHAILRGSPALDAGDPTAIAGVNNVPLFDQRGTPLDRVTAGDFASSARIDIGAHEYKNVVVDQLGDVVDGNTGTGELSLREALASANLGTADEITFAPALTNNGPVTISLTGGELTITNSMTISGPSSNLLAIDATGNDPTPALNNGDGSRVFNVSDANSSFIQVLISGLTLTGGDVATDGGAIYNSEFLSLSECTITGNKAGFNGGGVYNYYGNFNIINSTISANESRLGGGIANKTIFTFSANNTITSSTISGNMASMGGGGVMNLYGLMDIRHSTITGNTAPGSSGAGIASTVNSNFLYTGTIVHSSIIAGNTGIDVSSISNFPGTGPSVFSDGYNVIGLDNTGEFDRPGDQTGITNPLLGPLADNGGPTMTHALLAGSPAIDAGDPAFDPNAFTPPLVNDQRGSGFARVVDGRVDIGAFELQPIVASADFDEDGDVDGRDFLAWQRGFGTPAPTAVKADGDSDNDTDVDGADLLVWQEQYGEEELSAVSNEGSDPGDATPGRVIVDNFFQTAGTRETRYGLQSETELDDYYSEQVDIAIEELAATPTTVRCFGEMVARRGVKRSLANR
jgi:hypothetical protein